jgi:acetyl esterase/lipase
MPTDGAGDGDPASSSPVLRRSWLRWLLWIGLGLAMLLVVAVVVFVVASRNPSIDAFYDPPDHVSASPGTILRSEPFDHGVPEGARGWKVLYASTDPAGRPIAVSGLIIAPSDPAPGPHPVLAWAHGTTGVARACAPSLSDDPLEGIPEMTGPLARGWVLALTDYPGLGTPSPHPYLVGESEGRAVLDSVRAAHQLDTGVELDDRFAVWGHSQGGHAALFAGQLAHDYLPDEELVGVAALAPATRLHDNLAAVEGTKAGNVLSIFTVESWTDYYSDIPDSTLTERARRPAERLARSCINQPSRLRLLIAGLTLPDDVLAVDPTTDPTWTSRLDENSPSPDGVAAPLFVAQGLSDQIIAPAVTEAWTTARCETGAPTEWKTYDGVDHPAIVGPAGADALTWTADRFAGDAVPRSCPSR